MICHFKTIHYMYTWIWFKSHKKANTLSLCSHLLKFASHQDKFCTVQIFANSIYIYIYMFKLVIRACDTCSPPVLFYNLFRWVPLLMIFPCIIWRDEQEYVQQEWAWQTSTSHWQPTINTPKNKLCNMQKSAIDSKLISLTAK